ncbi:ribbon-helix-helix domain-containing protein [Kineococcus sp. SYSU DK005]|uniref:ribbon-helix-helix domain-containing protein n=1 Tax=Kineococcus sp. SYSU DK005 TaxID=3383126 RepID=UPI003D7E01F5
MELSISLSETDVAVLDEHVRVAGLPSRSAAVQRAIRLLAREQLEADYAAAWGEWEQPGERAAWEAVTGDGTAESGVEPAAGPAAEHAAEQALEPAGHVGAGAERGAGGAGAPR